MTVASNAPLPKVVGMTHITPGTHQGEKEVLWESIREKANTIVENILNSFSLHRAPFQIQVAISRISEISTPPSCLPCFKKKEKLHFNYAITVIQENRSIIVQAFNNEEIHEEIGALAKEAFKQLKRLPKELGTTLTFFFGDAKMTREELDAHIKKIQDQYLERIAI